MMKSCRNVGADVLRIYVASLSPHAGAEVLEVSKNERDQKIQ